MAGNSTIFGRTTGGEYIPVQVDSNGVVQTGGGTSTFQATRATASTGTAVTGTVTSSTVFASNANRLGAALYYDGTARVYVNLGTAAASVSSKTLEMAGSAYYEVPFAYTGVVTVAASANNGTVYGTTLT